MIYKTFQYNFDELNISVSHIEKILGYKQGESLEIIAGLIGKIIGEAKAICKIKAEYRIFENINFDYDAKTVAINDLKFDVKKVIYGQVRKSTSAALFLCTAGEGIGVRSRMAMKNGDLLEGYIYDVTGTEIVETAADIMQNELEKDMGALGRKITNRFSPGYCGWDVAEQQKLFQLMSDNYCGIRLTPSALMIPEKSVSGMVGIGVNVKRLPYSCNLCDMENCIYSRKT
ncbi:MAG: vitamin B12 dependent-methionine synthase activation domain-containing protein [Bacteroidales bacterium]|jgi:hypothetical protein